MADGSFLLQDAYGSSIMSNKEGDILIQPSRVLVMNAMDHMVRDKETGMFTSINPATDEQP